VAEPLELGGQLARVDRLRGGRERIQRPRVHRQEAALAVGEVEQEGVAVQVGVGRPARLDGDLAAGAKRPGRTPRPGALGELLAPPATGAVPTPGRRVHAVAAHGRGSPWRSWRARCPWQVTGNVTDSRSGTLTGNLNDPGFVIIADHHDQCPVSAKLL